MFFYQRNWSSLLLLLLLLFIYLFLALALSQCSTLPQTLKFSRKKDLALLLFFSPLKSGWPCDLPPKHAGCLKGKFSLQITCARAPLLKLTNAALYYVNTLFSHPISLSGISVSTQQQKNHSQNTILAFEVLWSVRIYAWNHQISTSKCKEMKAPFLVHWHSANCYHKVLLLWLLFGCLLTKMLIK